MSQSKRDEAAPPQPQNTAAGRVAGVVVTHGQVANELLAAAETIIGHIKHITAVSIGWHDDVDAASNEIERAVSRVSEGRGVLLLTDMFGGTPTNIASMFLKEGEVEVVTGVNLPMVIKLASQTGEESLTEVARRVRDQGREGIYLAGEFLTGGAKKS
ncbi:MAG TPA: PTS sugar transporter subunit IIA [Pyrinomonadaceae bacterium]|jgi:PTS system mannose-specific IIA component|nr:PTS sugar transporter subunit IIA [Pyrinomonadaceae bacterium]